MSCFIPQDSCKTLKTFQKYIFSNGIRMGISFDICSVLFWLKLFEASGISSHFSYMQWTSVLNIQKYGWNFVFCCFTNNMIIMVLSGCLRLSCRLSPGSTKMNSKLFTLRMSCWKTTLRRSKTCWTRCRLYRQKLKWTRVSNGRSHGSPTTTWWEILSPRTTKTLQYDSRSINGLLSPCL